MIFYRGNRCDNGSGKKVKKAKRVIPGFGLSLGVTITLLSLVVLIPLAALVIYTAQMSPSEFGRQSPVKECLQATRLVL